MKRGRQIGNDDEEKEGEGSHAFTKDEEKTLSMRMISARSHDSSMLLRETGAQEDSAARPPELRMAADGTLHHGQEMCSLLTAD